MIKLYLPVILGINVEFFARSKTWKYEKKEKEKSKLSNFLNPTVVLKW